MHLFLPIERKINYNDKFIQKHEKERKHKRVNGWYLEWEYSFDIWSHELKIILLKVENTELNGNGQGWRIYFLTIFILPVFLWYIFVDILHIKINHWVIQLLFILLLLVASFYISTFIVQTIFLITKWKRIEKNIEDKKELWLYKIKTYPGLPEEEKRKFKKTFKFIVEEHGPNIVTLSL